MAVGGAVAGKTGAAHRVVTSGSFGFTGYWHYAGWRPYFYYWYQST